MSATGTWTMSVKTPMGQQKSTLVLQEDAGTLTGTMQDAGAEPLPIRDGTVQGNSLEWKFDVKKPFPTAVQFTVTLDGNAFSGKAKAGFLPAAPVSATRA